MLWLRRGDRLRTTLHLIQRQIRSDPIGFDDRLVGVGQNRFHCLIIEPATGHFGGEAIFLVDPVEGLGFTLSGGEQLLLIAPRLVDFLFGILLRGEDVIERLDHLGRRVGLVDFDTLHGDA